MQSCSRAIVQSCRCANGQMCNVQCADVRMCKLGVGVGVGSGHRVSAFVPWVLWA